MGHLKAGIWHLGADKDMDKDTVDWIEKLKSWRWGLLIDSQSVTWTAFAILAMFDLYLYIGPYIVRQGFS